MGIDTSTPRRKHRPNQFRSLSFPLIATRSMINPSRHEQPIHKINMRMAFVLIQSAYAVPEMLFFV
jgi:hypothetical protein